MQVTWRNGLDGAEVAEIRDLLARAEQADGVAPVGEQVLLRLTARQRRTTQIEPVQADVIGCEHFVLRDEQGQLLGYAQLDTSGNQPPLVAELVVDPDYRGQGVGTQLVRSLLERADLPEFPQKQAASEAGQNQLRIWSHGQHPAALRLAAKFGFGRVRELWQMRREFAPMFAMCPESGPGGPSPAHDIPELEPPQGVRIRTFQPGLDEAELVRVNARAFAWHPEQGRMTVSDLQAKEDTTWFNPAGLFLAVDSSDRLLGFHWTKIHPDGIGEVYVLGVDPDTHGNGLGRVLTAIGLRWLREQNCPAVILYVEGDNAPAIRVYQRLGFTRVGSDVQFGR